MPNRNLSTIEEAVKRVVPEIETRHFDSDLGFMEDTIRLADVLLAIQQRDRNIEAEVEKVSGRGGAVCNGLRSALLAFASMTDIGREFWNLREDDLTKQSEETLSFLAQLLTNT